MKRLIFSILALSLFAVVEAQEKTISKYHYWIDQNQLCETVVDIQDGSTELDFSIGTDTLPEGFHCLYLRVQDSDGAWSNLTSWGFFVREFSMNDTIEVVSCEYWIDNNYKDKVKMPVDSTCIAFTVDASMLNEGLHTLNYRVQDSEGMYSLISTAMFFRNPLRDTTVVNKVTELEYWFDNDTVGIQRLDVSTDTIVFSADASMLNEGLHTLNYRVQDSEGMYSQISTAMFFRNPLRDTTIVNKVTGVEYWFDNDTAGIQRLDVSTDTIVFSADASMLNEGLHTLAMRVRDVLGNKSIPTTWIFYKSDYKAPSKISWYKYWWNNHLDKMETMMTECDSAVYTLSRELIVPDYAKTDGYSRNNTARFHIVFGDDAGHVSNVEYVDVSYPDNYSPVSDIKAEVKNNEINLTWSANEDGIEFYNIYVSENELPFVLWKPNTTETTATFKGQKGIEYRFTVTARDKAGNMERLDETKNVEIYFNH